MRRERLRCLLLTLIWAAGGAEDSCPAGPRGAACRGDEPAAAPHGAAGEVTSAPAPLPPSSPQSDLITQEMEELKTLLKMGDERMAFLKELQGAAAGKGLKGLPLSDSQMAALTEGLPLLSEIAGQGERAPIAAAEDFLVTKAIMPLPAPVAQIEWLVLRNPRPSASSSSSPSSAPQSQTPTCILIAVEADGNIRLFSTTGELLLTFEAGHDSPITHIATSPTHEEHLVATGDAGGIIRVHRISVRQRRVTKEEKASRANSSDEKLSQYLGSQLNITTQLHKQLQLPAGDGSLSALAIANHKSAREVVAGDTMGRISVFAKNGTLKGQVDATAMEGPGVEGLHSFHSQVIFRAGMEWGYVNLDKAEVKHIDCPKFEGRVAAISVDSQQLSKVFLSDDSGGVWIFNVKNRKECEFEKKFPLATDFKVPLELATIRGFVIGLQKSTPSDFPTSSLLALNLSHSVGRRRPAELGPGGHVIWRRPKLPIRDWSVQRKQHGDVVALLSEDGREVEILEILMQVYTPPPSSDPFSNFKLPVMAVAVVLLLGYQFMKQKGKGGSGGLGLGGGRGGKFGKSDFASLLNKKKGGLGGFKGKRP
mmetsp:Transcript_16359/g.38731  ORF Transcript_16359/g.38731 Transcript_16359/m.38731 type:complete len:594 (-) Transcript_16359:126-1907(-)